MPIAPPPAACQIPALLPPILEPRQKEMAREGQLETTALLLLMMYPSPLLAQLTRQQTLPCLTTTAYTAQVRGTRAAQCQRTQQKIIRTWGKGGSGAETTVEGEAVREEEPEEHGREVKDKDTRKDLREGAERRTGEASGVSAPEGETGRGGGSGGSEAGHAAEGTALNSEVGLLSELLGGDEFQEAKTSEQAAGGHHKLHGTQSEVEEGCGPQLAPPDGLPIGNTCMGDPGTSLQELADMFCCPISQVIPDIRLNYS